MAKGAHLVRTLVGVARAALQLLGYLEAGAMGAPRTVLKESVTAVTEPLVVAGLDLAAALETLLGLRESELETLAREQVVEAPAEALTPQPLLLAEWVVQRL